MLAWERGLPVGGGIHFLAAVGLRALFSCWRGTLSTPGGCATVPCHAMFHHMTAHFLIAEKSEPKADTIVFYNVIIQSWTSDIFAVSCTPRSFMDTKRVRIMGAT